MRRLLCSLLCVAGLFVSGFGTFSAQADSHTFITTGDAMVTEGSVVDDMNWGDDDALLIGRLDADYFNKVRGLVAFDLSGIPEGVPIVSARLCLYHYAHSAGYPGFDTVDVSVYRMKSAWDEDEVTWDRCDDDWGSKKYATQSLGEDRLNSWIEWDVTELVREWQDGIHENHGVGLRGYEGSRDNEKSKAFRSREYSTAYRPQLKVEWEAPTPTPSNTPTATASPTNTPTNTATHTMTPEPTSTPTSTSTPKPTPEGGWPVSLFLPTIQKGE